jgi:hypothetical protein
MMSNTYCVTFSLLLISCNSNLIFFKHYQWLVDYLLSRGLCGVLICAYAGKKFLNFWYMPVVIILKRINPVHLPTLFWDFYNYPPVYSLPSRLVSQSGFPTKNLYAHICCPLHVPCHTPVIVFVSSSWQYLVRSRNYEAPCAVFASRLRLGYQHTLSLYVPYKAQAESPAVYSNICTFLGRGMG